MSREYALELLECYEHPKDLSRGRDEWMTMLSHGDQTDCDIMELVSERDALRARINALRDGIITSMAKKGSTDEWIRLNEILAADDTMAKKMIPRR